VAEVEEALSASVAILEQQRQRYQARVVVLDSSSPPRWGQSEKCRTQVQ